MPSRALIVVRCFKSGKDSSILIFGEDGGSGGDSAGLQARDWFVWHLVCNREQRFGGFSHSQLTVKVSQFLCPQASQLE